MSKLDGKAGKPRILCFVAYYLPGFRSGGPVRTIANWVEHFGDEFDIWIVTKDRDALDTRPYPDIAIDAWNQVGKARVFYASKAALGVRRIGRLLSETPHDLLYLNSFFNYGFTILPLLSRRLGLAENLAPCLIAPRGEFSAGALRLKERKKRTFMALARLTGLYKNVSWQASSEFEKNDIQREFAILPEKIAVAIDLPPKSHDLKARLENRLPGPLRIVFLSRISPMKNLDFLLRIISKVNVKISLSIIGPLSEPKYWMKCQKLITELPDNVEVQYRGEVAPTEVGQTFAKHDLFAFPTKGENYGHVILESLTAGTPVVLSDQTPWHATPCKAISTISLDQCQQWINVIQEWAKLGDNELKQLRIASIRFAREYLAESGVTNDNRRAFLEVIYGT